MLQTFHVARRLSHEGYWLQAESKHDARRFVSLNVSGAEDADDAAKFSYFVDETRRPPIGFIIDQEGKHTAIERS